MKLSEGVSWQEIPPCAGEAVSSAPCPGRGGWLVLVRALADWPQNLLRQWAQDLTQFFPRALGKTPPQPGKGGVVLCQSVSGCPMKKDGDIENRSCHQYAAGLCCEATVAVSGRVSVNTVALFLGLDAATTKALRTESVKKWTQEVLNDPELVDVIKRFGWSEEWLDKKRESLTKQ
jgi:hypothetical protein